MYLRVKIENRFTNEFLKIPATMNRQKISLGAIILLLGLLGVASMLTMDIPLPPEAESMLKESFTDQQIKFLLLINPTILVLIAVAIGTALYSKVNLTVPIIEKMVGLRSEEVDYADILKYGVLGGVLSGISIVLVSQIFTPLLPAEFTELNNSLELTLAARFLYGGITEEILMRFGLMSFVVWLVSKIVGHTKSMVYWIGILIAAIVFAIGHFPAVYGIIEEPSSTLFMYIIIGNSIGGIIFGWLYWKKGLESAFLGHIFAHVAMVLGELIIG